ncbi:hypothetical protein EU545_02555 [Candidatus Thorarchaeota archaeon]|nr:MAG: hypothetical protein EU545_02555 [Candidatus Thorarchaeota archaeon]
MVEKEFGDKIRVHPRFRLSYREHERGLVGSYDHELLMKYLPPTSGLIDGDKALSRSLRGVIPDSTIEALDSTEFVGVYGRVIHQTDDPEVMCLQYLFVWDYQAVPAHECDYEPVFVYVLGNDAYMIYDFVHYCSRRLDSVNLRNEGFGLRVVPGWHSFLPVDELGKHDEIDSVKPLSDQHLRTWWSIPDEAARLKIEGFLRDPFLLEAPGHFLDEPDENAQTICCTFLEIENALKEFDDPRKAVIEGSKRALAKCVGILALYRLGAYLQLLGEMRDLGMLRMAIESDVGIDLSTIGTMLRDGFISLTKTGGEILKGLLSNTDVDDG